MQYAILIVAITLLVLAMWFVVRLFRCLFSAPTRALVRRRWLLHTVWGLFSVAYLGFAVLSGMADQDYSSRAKVQEGFAYGAPAKLAVTEYWMQHGQYPANNEEAGVPPPDEVSGTYVDSVTVLTGGEILIRYSDSDSLPEDARGRTIRLVPTPRDDALLWDCTGGDMPADLRSASCR